MRTIRGEIGPARDGTIYAMALSPDQRWLAAGGWFDKDSANVPCCGDIRLYDFASGELKALLKGHSYVVSGLAFSPDESILYVVASRAVPNRLIRAFDVVDGGKKLANNRVFIDAETGTPDGFRVDIAGNLWCGWGMGDAELDGVRVFDATGKPIGHIALPERAANLCFGGRFRNRVFMAASHGLYALYVNTQGTLGG